MCHVPPKAGGLPHAISIALGGFNPVEAMMIIKFGSFPQVGLKKMVEITT